MNQAPPPERVRLRDRPLATRWGGALLQLTGIAALYYNGAAEYPVWQWATQAALAPLVVTAVVLRARLPWLLPGLGVAAIIAGTPAVFMIGMLSLAMRRSGPRVWLLGLAGGIALFVRWLADAHDVVDPVGTILLSMVPAAAFISLVPLLVGGQIRSRRQLEASAAEQAVRAEFERELAAQQAAHAERERIAREMHDSLGHVLALVTMQAGALEVGARDTEVISAARGIRQTARSGLAELRVVVRALGEDTRLEPAPGLSAVPRLVEASRDARGVVSLTDDLADAEALPSSTGRVVYQVIQETLTNAHRHAPGAPVDISLSGAPDAGLTVTVANPLVPGGERGSGTGLAALRGRVQVLGGELDARARSGRFELQVRLPWVAAA